MQSFDPLALANSALLLIGFVALVGYLRAIATHLHVLSVCARLKPVSGQERPIPIRDDELRTVFERLEDAPNRQVRLHMPQIFKPWKYPEEDVRSVN